MADLYTNGVRYYRLYFACPVCRERGYNTYPFYWTHAYCGGDIYVGSDATYFCGRCKRISHVRNWKYSCPFHSSSYEAHVGLHFGDSTDKLVETLGTCCSFVSLVGLRWINEFLENF